MTNNTHRRDLTHTENIKDKEWPENVNVAEDDTVLEYMAALKKRHYWNLIT